MIAEESIKEFKNMSILIKFNIWIEKSIEKSIRFKRFVYLPLDRSLIFSKKIR